MIAIEILSTDYLQFARLRLSTMTTIVRALRFHLSSSELHRSNYLTEGEYKQNEGYIMQHDHNNNDNKRHWGIMRQLPATLKTRKRRVKIESTGLLRDCVQK
jgi:hypothetical protein